MYYVYYVYYVFCIRKDEKGYRLLFEDGLHKMTIDESMKK